MRIAETDSDKALIEPLTPREGQMLVLLAEGYSRPEIATRLTLALTSVKFHIQHLYGKLGVKSKRQALGRATELGLLAPPAPAALAAGPGGLAAQPGRKHNLPMQITRFFGREAEIAQLRDRLDHNRLVTLTGSGGVGKTRLSLRVAEEALGEFTDGVWFVELASLSDPGPVPAAIAQVLGVSQRQGEALPEALSAFLREQQTLLLLDNFEQVVEAAPLVVALLAAAPRLKVLVTSREMLRVSGEHTYPVPPLALPDPAHLPPLAALQEYAAIQLFVARARAVKPSFALIAANAAAVAEICVRLDGLPLALELAASRVRHLPPRAILDRLEHPLPLLTGGPRDLPARQQTLRDTIAWSHDLLNQGERVLFRRLAVFAGGCPLEAAERICQADLAMPVLDGLNSLVDKSLLMQFEAFGETRYAMLETIREFALEQLDLSGECPDLRRRHAEQVLERLQRAIRETYDQHAERRLWLDRIEADHDNVRAALHWALENGSPTLVSQLYRNAFWFFWEPRGYIAEATRWLEAVLAATAGGQVEPTPRVWLLTIALRLCAHRRDVGRMSRWIDEILALRPSLEGGNDLWVTYAALGQVARDRGDYALARELFEQCLRVARRLDQDLSWPLLDLAEVVQLQGELARAGELYEDSELLFRERGDSIGVAWSLHNQGHLALTLGQTERALACLRESLASFAELGAHDGIVSCLAGLAGLELQRGDGLRAARLLGLVEAMQEAAGAGLRPVARVAAEPLTQAVRRDLGDSAFQFARAAGRAMSLDQVLLAHVSIDP